MFSKRRIIGSISLGLGLLAGALFFSLPVSERTEAGQSDYWLTMDAKELATVRQASALKGAPLIVEVLTEKDGIAMFRANEEQITRLSEHTHEQFHKCAGFIAHDSESEALNSIDETSQAKTAQNLLEYTINNPRTVQSLIDSAQASQVLETITRLSTDFTNRYYKSTTGSQSAQWIKDKWTSYAAGRSDVTVENYTHTGWTQPSIIMTIQGRISPNEIVVVGAHQDTIRSGCSDATTCQTLPGPGADDDASGIASMTEAIRVMMVNGYKPDKTVKFMAYSGEERGLLGSRDIATAFRNQNLNVIGVMQLDMTNYNANSPTIDFAFESSGTYANQQLTDFLKSLVTRYLPTLNFVNTTCGYGCSDHYSWHQKSYPAAFPFEAPFNQSNNALHTANDTIVQMGNSGAHGVKFSKLAAAFVAETAKGTTIASRPRKFDFDSDGKSDLAVFRPSNGTWYTQNSTAGFRALQFGLNNDKPIAADFNGDGTADYAVFRPSNDPTQGDFFVYYSGLSTFEGFSFGDVGDVPVVSDYDGDGKADIAVFRPSNGTWYIIRSSDKVFTSYNFGLGTDKLVPADYDGDGKTDFAVYRNGTWYLTRSSANYQFVAYGFGASGDIAVPSDFDGDGKADVAVFRPSTGIWYITRGGNIADYYGLQFGASGDVPVAADYDGDGKDDIAVYRNGVWYQRLSANNQFFGYGFGLGTDIAAPDGLR